MKWFTYWWGIEISAENEEDEKLLKLLVERLTPKANEAYDKGIFEVGEEAKGEFVNRKGFTITFNR